MMLRRIASALRRQDWAAVLIELTLVVTGVLIALAASDLYTQRIQRQSELIMLDHLRAGLIGDAETLQQAIQRRQRINLIDYRLGTIRQGELPFFADARAQVLQLIDRIDAERGGKAEAVPGGAEA